MAVKVLRESKSVKDIKLAELRAACNAAIVGGIDVGGEHFSLEMEDQKNLLALSLTAATGQSVPYHADGQPCRLYTPEEFDAIAAAATSHTTYHTTYFNALKQWVARESDMSKIAYGAKLPKDLDKAMSALLGGGGS